MSDFALRMLARLCDLGILIILIVLIAGCGPKHLQEVSDEPDGSCEAITNKYVLPEPHETLDPGTSTAILFDSW